MEKLGDRVVHEFHAEFFAGLDDAWKHEGLSFADHISDSGGVHQNLNRQRATIAVRPRHELLRDDAAQRLADHDANLVALIGRKNIQQSVESSRGIAGVQGAEHKVTGLGRRDGEGDSLQIAHFTNHDDIRILTESASQGVGEGFCMRVNLTLSDMALARRHDVFDRILQSDDMVVARAVDLIHQRSERSALSATNGAGHEHQTVVKFCEQFQLLWKAQLIHRTHAVADDSKYEIVTGALAHDTRAEAPDASGVGEIHIAALGELLLLVR